MSAADILAITESLDENSTRLKELAEKDFVDTVDPVVAVHNLTPLQAIVTSGFALQGNGVSTSISVSSTAGFEPNDKVFLAALDFDGFVVDRAYLYVVSVTNSTSLEVARYGSSQSLSAANGTVFPPGSELAGQTRLPSPPAGKEIASITLTGAYNPQTWNDSDSSLLAKDLVEEGVALAYVGFKTSNDIDLHSRLGTPIKNGTVLSFDGEGDLDLLRIFGATASKYAPIIEIVYRGRNK